MRTQTRPPPYTHTHIYTQKPINIHIQSKRYVHTGKHEQTDWQLQNKTSIQTHTQTGRPTSHRRTSGQTGRLRRRSGSSLTQIGHCDIVADTLITRFFLEASPHGNCSRQPYVRVNVFLQHYYKFFVLVFSMLEHMLSCMNCSITSVGHYIRLVIHNATCLITPLSIIDPVHFISSRYPSCTENVDLQWKK